jgi:hypothetical protein
MSQVVHTDDVTLAQLEEWFGLKYCPGEVRLRSLLDALPPLSTMEIEAVDLAQREIEFFAQFSLEASGALVLLALSPLLKLAGYYGESYEVKTQKIVQALSTRADVELKGQVPLVVQQGEDWVVAIATGNSLAARLPRLMACLMARPEHQRLGWGLMTNGLEFQVIVVEGLAVEVSPLWKVGQDLGQVAQVLKGLGQAVPPRVMVEVG